MGQYIPKINLPLDAVAHAKWLEGQAISQELFNAEVRRFMAQSGKAISAGARQTTVINNKDDASGLLPPGGIPGDALIKKSTHDFHAEWAPIVGAMGGMRQEYYNLPADGTVIDLLDRYEPKLFEFYITPEADGDPFSITVPNGLNFDNDLQLPFYILSVYVTGHSADLTIAGNPINYYDRRSTPLLGMTVAGGAGTVTLPAGFAGQWFVLVNFSNGDHWAIPMQDPYYDATIGSAVSVVAAPSVSPTGAAGTGPTVDVNGTSLGGVVELVTGTSPTVTGWGELLTFTDAGWGAGEEPVLVLTPANQAAAALTHYSARGSGSVGAIFDLTGLSASTTYEFNYSLLPFTA